MGEFKSVDLIQQDLFALQDEGYRDFQKKLFPGLELQMIGVRTPQLRTMAKTMMKDDIPEAFLGDLPHRYFDENQLHGFLISLIKDYDTCMAYLEAFLPYINNWATCDQTSPKVFAKHKEELLVKISNWMKSDHEYTVRFGIGMLMQHYLDGDFRPEFLQWVCNVDREEYYIKMEVAWYMATALAKQWDATIRIVEAKKLPVWTHNKTIQKAIESYRITAEQKDYLRTLKIK